MCCGFCFLLLYFIMALTMLSYYGKALDEKATAEDDSFAIMKKFGIEDEDLW